MVITWVDGKSTADVAGMTIGLFHDDGTTTVAGTYTNKDDGTVTINAVGTVTTTAVGTELGTFVYSTIATDGDDAIMITYVEGKSVTNEAGTTTGLDQVDGTVTEFVTYNETTAVDGTV
jgi:hypothetical protein